MPSKYCTVIECKSDDRSRHRDDYDNYDQSDFCSRLQETTPCILYLNMQGAQAYLDGRPFSRVGESYSKLQVSKQSDLLCGAVEGGV